MPKCRSAADLVRGCPSVFSFGGGSCADEPTSQKIKRFTMAVANCQEKASAEIRGELLRTKFWVNFVGDF